MILNFKLRNKERNKNIHYTNTPPTYTELTPHVNRRRPPRKQILLIDTIYSVMVRQTGVAGVLKSPDYDHSIIKRWQSKKKAESESEAEISSEEVVLPKTPEKDRGSTIIINKINNVFINPTVINNVYFNLENMVEKGEKKINKKSHHVLWNDQGIVKMNGRFDGGVIKEEGKYTFYNGSELTKERENYIFSLSEKKGSGEDFYMKLKDPKVTFESVDFPLDIYLGENEVKLWFQTLTNKYKKKHFTTDKITSVIDSSGREFSYKKENFYEKKSKQKKETINVNEIGHLETLYLGHRERTGITSVKIYDKYSEREEEEWKGILRIEAHIKKDKMEIINDYREGKITQKEMARKIIEEIIKPSITFRQPSKTKIKQESMYKSPVSKWWEAFLKLLKDLTYNMETLDDDILKEKFKLVSKVEYLFIDSEIIETKTEEETKEEENKNEKEEKFPE